MPSILRSPLWLNPTLVPAIPVEVDWEHPLALRLAAFYVPGSRNGMLDLTCLNGPLSQTVTAPGMTSIGPGLYLNGTTSKASIPNFGMGGATQLTISVTARIESGGGANPRIIANSHLDNGGAAGMEIFYEGVSKRLYFWLGNGSVKTSAYVSVVLPSFAGTVVSIAAIYDGSTVQIYFNGAIGGVTGTLTGAVSPGTTSAMGIGYNPLYNGDFASITVIDAMFSAAVYSPDQIAWLAAEPFAMLRPIQPRRTWSVPSGPIRTRPRVMLIA